jgi:hypothetical protein
VVASAAEGTFAGVPAAPVTAAEVAALDTQITAGGLAGADEPAAVPAATVPALEADELGALDRVG